MGRRRLEGVPIKVQGLPSKRPLSDYVYESVKRMIVKGELEPGTRLVESRIATQLSISRT
ncbi:MAG: GntR family transcriptional regulator, partial [Desulfatiglandales bacterium]